MKKQRNRIRKRGKPASQNAAPEEPSGPERQLANLATARISRVQFEGPLPPPAILSAYDKILTGGAERVFDFAEAEQKIPASGCPPLSGRVVRGDKTGDGDARWWQCSPRWPRVSFSAIWGTSSRQPRWEASRSSGWPPRSSPGANRLRTRRFRPRQIGPILIRPADTDNRAAEEQRGVETPRFHSHRSRILPPVNARK